MAAVEILTIFLLSLGQQIVSSMGSRAKNRNNNLYIVLSAIVSHALFILTMMGVFKVFEFTYWFGAVYIIGATIGNLVGANASMWIEKRFNIHI